MHKSSLIKILKSLDAREFRELGEVVRSPFFNKNESSKKLYDYLKKHYPEFKKDSVEKEKVFARIFEKADYNDGFMRTVIFNLGELAEEYLKQVNLRNDKPGSELLLLDELNKRKLDKEFNKNLNKAGREIEKNKNVMTEYYFHKFRYQHLVNSYINWSRFRNKNLKDNDNFELAMENKYLFDYTLIKTLANYRSLIIKKENFNSEYNSGILDDLINYALSNPDEFTEAPSVKLHAYEVLLLKTKDDKYYRILKEILLKGEGTQDELYSLLNILQVFCTHKIYDGNISYSEERFVLYKSAIENNFYRGSEDVYFDSLLFPNIALSAFRNKQFEWAEDFIDRYKNELPPEEKEVVTGYIEGRLKFETGAFEKALEIVEGIKLSRHLQYKVIIKNLTLLLYLELGYYDKADAQFASYRQYLSANEKYFAPQRFIRFTDFMKYYNTLLKILSKMTAREDEDTKTNELNQLLSEIEKNTNVIERDWLLRKVKEMAG